MSDSARETDVHDLSLGAVEALELIPLHKLADDQLRHLYAALVHACNEVDEELASRSDDPTMDDTVKLHVADIDKED